MGHMYPSFSKRTCLSLTILALVIPAQTIKRTVGPATDPRFQNASRICNGSDPRVFEFRTCSLLIDCVYDNLTEAFKASLSSGTSIAALLPTILVLIGEPSQCFSTSTISLIRVGRTRLVSPTLTNYVKVHRHSRLFSLLYYHLTVLLQPAASPSASLAVYSGN